MKKLTITTVLILYFIGTQIYAQSVVISKGNTSLGPNDFPELIYTYIPGAPKLGNPQLIIGESKPVKGEGMGWAAPAVYDWNKDKKRDLLIGEFHSGMKSGISIGSLIRIYQNKGTDDNPKFYDEFRYAHGVHDLKESTGSPISINTSCCLAFTPRFADLDNDGYIDLLSGQYSPGYISWFRGSEKGFLRDIKLEEAYDPIIDMGKDFDAYSLPITDPKGMWYWLYSSADFGDFDNDGDQDMIVGGKALRICENIGTKTTPKFGKRELLFDLQGKQLESNTGASTVPYVVDWDQDGLLDILLTDAYTNKGCEAVIYFRGLKPLTRPEGGKMGLQFEAGIPLFTAKNGEKAFPGSWLNVCVTDWNNDGINDMLIGTSIATLNYEFSYDLSWNWEHDTHIAKKNPKYYSVKKEELIAAQLKGAEKTKQSLGLDDDKLDKKGYPTKNNLIKSYYGKEEYKNLAHQGYVYVMLGEK